MLELPIGLLPNNEGVYFYGAIEKELGGLDNGFKMIESINSFRLRSKS